jgi:ADP-ribose pyrophosphatase YjhB (NUDIX family)
MHTDIDWQNPPPLRLGALGLLLDPAGHVLFVEKTYKTGPARFGLPGGCAAAGEDARAACAREIREEIGLHVSVGDVLVVHHMHGGASSAPGENIVLHCGTLSGGERMTLGDEIAAVRWVAPHEIAATVAPYTAARVLAALATLDGEPARYLVGHP